ncbi:Alpha-L-fucosidase, partial [Popillia japonica]
MQNWREHGLGQFIHWGVYAIPGGHWNGKYYGGAAEWIRSWKEMPKEEYDNLYKQFNPKASPMFTCKTGANTVWDNSFTGGYTPYPEAIGTGNITEARPNGYARGKRCLRKNTIICTSNSIPKR